jgi:hypothetical protein
MRHTAVSLWIAAGASDLEVAKWAGHRSVSFTKDRYAHLFPEHGDALAERLNVFMESATSMPAAPTATVFTQLGSNQHRGPAGVRAGQLETLEVAEDGPP